MKFSRRRELREILLIGREYSSDRTDNPASSVLRAAFYPEDAAAAYPLPSQGCGSSGCDEATLV